MKPTNGFTVLESDDYREEEKALKRDPIVIQMANECRNQQPPIADVELRSLDFMKAAMKEYHKRGGKQAHSIGGVGRAIRSLLNERT